MSESTDRPQDAGRPHKARIGAPTPEVAAILERYRAAMRDELGDVLSELRPPAAQLTIGGSEERIRPALADRLKLWDLAIKIGRELGSPGASTLEEPAPGITTSGSRRTTTGRAPRLSARDRKALGA